MDKTKKVSPFTEHLDELRRRLIFCLVYLVIGCVAGFFVTEKFLFEWILSPILAIPDTKLQVLGPVEKIAAYFKTSFIAGVVIAAPFIFHQVWLFLRPGLKAKERTYLLWLFPTSVLLFTIGVAFIFYVMIPTALRFLLGFDLGVEIEAGITLDRYFSFLLFLLLVGGTIFQIPLVTYFLARLGLVTHTMMANQRKVAILSTVILAALITPTGDPFNLFLLAIPIYLLYEISIIIALVFGKKKSESL